MAPSDLDEHTKQRAFDWLIERANGDERLTGFDAVGWEASTWVLHSIYEDTATADETTHNDARLDAVARGLVSPMIVGSVNLDELSTVVGNSLGMSDTPGAGWVRLRWSDLATRLSVSLEGHDWPPGAAWFPYRSWPVALAPPDEGSLDRVSLDALVEQLASYEPDGRATSCIAYYSPLANRGNFRETWMQGVELGQLATLVQPSLGRIGTPSNWWPIDRAWMVFTDWDLWATRVSGPLELINAIRSAPDLECIDWTSSSQPK